MLGIQHLKNLPSAQTQVALPKGLITTNLKDFAELAHVIYSNTVHRDTRLHKAVVTFTPNMMDQETLAVLVKRTIEYGELLNSLITRSGNADMKTRAVRFERECTDSKMKCTKLEAKFLGRNIDGPRCGIYCGGRRWAPAMRQLKAPPGSNKQALVFLTITKGMAESRPQPW
jgi:hypothetical protein